MILLYPNIMGCVIKGLHCIICCVIRKLEVAVAKWISDTL